MIGSIRWNLIFGLLGLVFTFIGSMSGNVWITTLLRSGYSFVILFALMFGFRWVFGTVVGLNRPAQASESDHRGAKLDLTTPAEEESLHRMIGGETAEPSTDEFKPLQPTKLVRKEELDPELLAGALRRMTEE